MSFETAVAAYLARRLPDAHDVWVSKLFRIPGGASRETWSVDAEWTEGNGKKRQQGFIIRRDPTASLVHSERELEFAFYQSFAGRTDVPVPRPFWLETDPGPLERPFFVMERIDGCDSQFQKLLDPSFAPHLPGLGRRMYEILGDIARTDVTDIPAAKVVDVPHPVECWRRELDYWEHMIDANELEPQPIARAGIRWLRRNPPPAPAHVGVVHGDYRTGNFLYQGDKISGILDWEMAHFGDPLEDLAWSFSECWQWARDGRAGGIIDRAEALRVWETRTGWRADPVALRWWDIFTCIKGQALWLTGAQEFASGRASDLVLAFTSYWLINSQDKFLLRLLGHLA